MAQVRLIDKDKNIIPTVHEYSVPNMLNMPRLIQFDNRIFRWIKKDGETNVYEEQS